MYFEQVLKHLQGGHYISRKSWGEEGGRIFADYRDFYYHTKLVTEIGDILDFTFSDADLYADDWYILEVADD